MVFFTLKRAEVNNKILEDASRERQEGIQGQWQQESPFKVTLEQVRGNADMGCGSQMRDGSWEEVQEKYRKKKIQQKGLSKEYAKLAARVAGGWNWTLGHCAGNFEEEHRFSAEGHRAGRCRRGIMDGLRSFTEMDNHGALDVGHLRKGPRPFNVQRPKIQ